MIKAGLLNTNHLETLKKAVDVYSLKIGPIEVFNGEYIFKDSYNVSSRIIKLSSYDADPNTRAKFLAVKVEVIC